MKKLAFTLFSLLPSAVFAQDLSSPSLFEYFGTAFLFLLICAIVLITCRELICWYYKINKRISNQEEIIRLLKKIANESNGPSNDTKLEEEKRGILKELANSTKFMVTGK